MEMERTDGTPGQANNWLSAQIIKGIISIVFFKSHLNKRVKTASDEAVFLCSILQLND